MQNFIEIIILCPKGLGFTCDAPFFQIYSSEIDLVHLLDHNNFQTDRKMYLPENSDWLKWIKPMD